MIFFIVRCKGDIVGFLLGIILIVGVCQIFRYADVLTAIFVRLGFLLFLVAVVVSYVTYLLS